MAPHSASQAPVGAAADKVDEPTQVALQYIESSALLAALLEQDRTMQAALAGVKRRIASALTFTEAERSLIRARVAHRISAPEERAAIRWLQRFGRRCDRIAVTDGILARAGRPFPAESVRTMDAIHLATLELLGAPPQLVEVITCNKRISANARAAGYIVID